MAETETEKQRIDRELIELLNELRVALPGVQVLFAFLLAIPFQQGFEKITDDDRRVYFAAVILTALSSAFLIAPSAHHRVRFRSKAKEELLKAASVYAIIGLAFLSAAMAATLWLITELLYSAPVASVTAALLGGFTVAFWFLVPLRYRADREPRTRNGRPRRAGRSRSGG